MSAILDDREKGIDRSCLITGQPGSGESRLSSFTYVCPRVVKTSYLYILLVDRLLKGQNTIFQTTKATVYEI